MKRSSTHMNPIVVKIGSQALFKDGVLDLKHIEQLIFQIIELIESKYPVCLVSSGAVAVGNFLTKDTHLQFQDHIQKRQVLASIGQPYLMSLYINILKKFNYYPAQILLNREDFRSCMHYENIRRALMGVLGGEKIIPILNENDTTTLTNLMFTDNDELASLVAGIVEAQRLILLTSTDGIYDRPPEEEGAVLIPHISIEESTKNIRLDGKTTMGRGGMISKLSSCKKAASLGVITHIANAREKNVLMRLVKNQESLGTVITGSCHLKGVKRWLSYSPTPPCSIIVDNNLKLRLLNNTLVSSILPIGVLKVIGDFQKDDIIAIKDVDNTTLGLGLSEYSSDDLKSYLGTYNQKPITRYEKMFIKS